MSFSEDDGRRQVADGFGSSIFRKQKTGAKSAPVPSLKQSLALVQ
jgi:hypothetical protein